MNEWPIIQNSGQGMRQGPTRDRNQKLEPRQLPAGSHSVPRLHVSPLQPQFLPPVPAASLCFLHSHFRAENPAIVFHALRVKSNILPITYTPSMTCSLHPHHSHRFIQPLFSSPMGLFSVPPRGIWSTHLWVLENGVSAS